ncbi:MAG TPA: hypothetical protein VFT00_01625 [Nocardioides sp.]|nr:hypothetical protein [Nocardioides sp.]
MNDPLLDALDRTRGRIEAIEALEGSDETEPLHPELEAALDAATGPDAPLELRRLGDRVRDGLLTWPQLWLHPHDHGAAGFRLVMSVLDAWAREATQLLDALQSTGSGPPRT